MEEDAAGMVFDHLAGVFGLCLTEQGLKELHKRCVSKSSKYLDVLGIKQFRRIFGGIIRSKQLE